MSTQASMPMTLSIDLKKYRIRIHKSTLHLLGDPQYIQLLVHPENKVVAIRSVSHESPTAQTHKIDKKQLQSDNSVDLYSRTLITRLCEVACELDSAATYRLYGEMIPAQNLAVFSLKTLRRVGSL